VDNTINDESNPITTPAPAKAPHDQKPAPQGNDLSAEVERVVDREPLDWVRCVRVFGDFYRCNWWSRKGPTRQGQDFDWAALITDHVRKSRFYKVTLQMGKLVIDEVKSDQR
jgi:hypothetical protein